MRGHRKIGRNQILHKTDLPRLFFVTLGRDPSKRTEGPYFESLEVAECPVNIPTKHRRNEFPQHRLFNTNLNKTPKDSTIVPTPSHRLGRVESEKPIDVYRWFFMDSQHVLI